MNTASLKKFATEARNKLIAQITAKLTYVLKEETAELKAKKFQIGKLREEIGKSNQQQVIETAAYTWFNRFIALRFMDVNGYTSPRVLTPDDGHTVPAILQDAKSGVFPDELLVNKERVLGLIDGKIQHPNPQAEAFRMLIVASCNSYGTMMPFLFEQIEDWTELLIPDDLLSDNSILTDVRDGMPVEDCKQEEVIGWLYQYYIAEKKDMVFEGLKKNQKITPENIPAATQLFTPHWIVRYLVENTLGKLWLQLKPGSGLRAHMPYYIEQEPAGPLPDGIKSITDITFLDPCTGSGHILVYAFELFCRMYEEEGYDTHEIPSLILQHNIFGLEIDDRAAALAGFALYMKSRSVDKRFFKRGVLPNVKAFRNVNFEKAEIEQYMARVGIDVFTADLAANIAMLAQAKNFGSLIRPVPLDIPIVKQAIGRADVAGDAFLAETHNKVVDGLDIIERLQRKYSCVVTNPPYMGGKGMNEALSKYAAKEFPDSKSDLFAMFIERGFDFAVVRGVIGMITMQSWMFLSSYEELRKKILTERCILSMAHLGARGFDSIGGEVVQTTAFVIGNIVKLQKKGTYLRLIEGNCEAEKMRLFLDEKEKISHQASADDFGKIPGSPVAYWVSEKFRNTFVDAILLKQVVDPKQGMATGDNNTFLRQWSEVNKKQININGKSKEEIWSLGNKFVPYNKGGKLRKWFGNRELVIKFSPADYAVLKSQGNHCPSEHLYFKECITWSDITTNSFGVRYSPQGCIFDVKGSCGFPNKANLMIAMGFMNSKLLNEYMKILNPTVTFQVGDISRIPFPNIKNSVIDDNVSEIISKVRLDWNSYETSWDFTELPLLSNEYRVTSNELTDEQILATSYSSLRSHWQQMTAETKRFEEENNRIFIDAYGLQDELTPDVPIHEITLTCNPAYRYGAGKTEEEYATLQKADTMRELLSYGVGVLLGRYSLDKPGLILANQGEGVEEYKRIVDEYRVMSNEKEVQIPSSDSLLATQYSLLPDEDAIIPVLEDEYFSDDIVNKIKVFLAKAFCKDGSELSTSHSTLSTLSENIKFIEDALGKDLRKFFAKDFYNDHIKRYKKRPIYWMFASPKGTFRALIYMHRYRPDTLSQMLSNYLRPLIEKLKDEQVMCNREMVSETAAPADKTRAQKRLDKIAPQIEELTEYEQVLYRLAAKRIEIDLDDGVRVNYPKFAPAIVPIKGMEVEE